MHAESVVCCVGVGRGGWGGGGCATRVCGSCLFLAWESSPAEMLAKSGMLAKS